MPVSLSGRTALIISECQRGIVEPGVGGFEGTALDAMLRRMDVATIVMAGVSTNVAIAGCVMTAADLAYHSVVAEDCIAAADPHTHEVILRDQLRMLARIASAADIMAAIG